jgi:hypothetical protein
MAKGDDKRAKNMVTADQSRYFDQQGPMMNNLTGRWNQASDAGQSDYGDIMNRYRSFLGGNTGVGGAAGGGIAQSSYSDPFNSYGGYQDFSKTGGYSGEDVSNLRARGASPVRAVYANAERELNRNRALQGGYSPNFAAASAKMAREQSQGGADAMQNVNAGLAQMVQQGKLAGLGGMAGIEGQRLNADLQNSMFNAGQANSMSGEAAANQLRGLQGMNSMYGTTPGMSNMFGDQLINTMGQGGQYGLNSNQNWMNASKMPGTWDTTMGRIGDIGNVAAGVSYPWME